MSTMQYSAESHSKDGLPGNTEFLSDKDKAKLIKEAIMDAGDGLRDRYGFLAHQDTIGATVMALFVSVLIASSWAYYQGLLSAWVVILINALATSIIHELEHDLIHRMYFRTRAIPHNIMLALCWLTRPGTINPWIRRELHLEHHKLSGTEEDLEERAITNGEPWGIKRLFMLADGGLSILLRTNKAYREGKLAEILLRAAVAYFPLGIIHYALWYSFLGFHGLNTLAAVLGVTVEWSEATLALMPTVNFLAVVLLAPFTLRSFSINLVSSNMHYFGDVEKGNILQQTQVLTPWYLWPFQLFCLNFGKTHGIHHFVVRDPFYVRHWIADDVLPVMKTMGVRFNDIATFSRANSYHLPQPEKDAISKGAVPDVA